MSNRLQHEKSPYLLQHANNPVDWYPWGDAAFERARSERKPIFLSVGYSTCHWCHVMAHESFENDAIAGVLNEHFVSIKVDREERPDVDRVYMLFVQATTGSGGWPMSVWLTPELEPFHGGTYYPPTARWGRPGFIEILEEIARVWREDPDKVRRSAALVTAQLKQFAAGAGRAVVVGRVGEEALERGVEALRTDFDSRYGGFGRAPKFPRPSELFFLLREYARRASQEISVGRGSSLAGESARAAFTALNAAPATAAKDMALATLRAMARGGIHDHVGGGFHRYSVDARWHLPHFEKMLYDQAQLALAYLEAFQITHDSEFASVASAILGYVSRGLGREGGGFFSGEDADSVPARPNSVLLADETNAGSGQARDQEPGTRTSDQGPETWDRTKNQEPGTRTSDQGPGTRDRTKNQEPETRTRDQGPGTRDHLVEGAFYVWTDAEFNHVLGASADAARLRFGVRPDGNVESDPHGEFEGKNVLYLARTLEEVAAAVERPVDEVEALLERATRRLFQARSRRPTPGRDDKVIVAWNGLMIAAFARASRALRGPEGRPAPVPGGAPRFDARASEQGSAGSEDRFLDAARAAAQFIRTTMWDEPSGRLLRRYREGEAGIEAYADDFACLVFGLLELFQADGDPEWLTWAVTLQKRQDDLFWDEGQGGWFSSSGRDRSVLLRVKEDYDGAEPAPSSLSAWNLLTFAHITGEEEWTRRVDRTLGTFSTQLEQTPRAMPMMLAALSSSLAAKQEIVIVGGHEHGAGELWSALASRYLPFAVVMPLAADNQAAVARVLPFTEAMTMRDGRATAYVCRDFACSRPTTDADEMLKQVGPLGLE